MHHLPEPSALITGLRIYVVVMAVLVAALGTFQIKRWSRYLPENQLAWIAVALLNLSAGEGCLESILRHVPGGAKTWFVALAVTFEWYAVAYHPAKKLWRRWRVHRIAKRASAECLERESA